MALPPPLPSPEPTTNPADAPLSSSVFTRPISLSSPTDLAHLRAQALRAARAKIDLHLPAATNTTATPGGGGGALRADVERRVDAYLAAVFEAVRANVAVNGIPGVEAVSFSPRTRAGGAAHEQEQEQEQEQEHFEAYDAALAQRLTAAHARIETLHAGLAETRREAAATGARGFAEGFEAWSAAMEQREQREDAKGAEASAAVEQAREPLAKGVPFAGREERVRAALEGAVRAGEGARERLEAAGVRAEEARRVVEYLGTGA